MRLPRFFPLFMTAAGTVPPAKVLVLGAGVAGLQAIATAKRLGAVVRRTTCARLRRRGALDGRHLPGPRPGRRSRASAATPASFAGPRGPPAGAARTAPRADRRPDYDGRVPGRPAPLLVTARMLAGMQPGTVAVDLAAESGGNIEAHSRERSPTTSRRQCDC